MSNYLSIVDDTDLQKDNPQWKPSEWINTRSYKRRRKDWFTAVTTLNTVQRHGQPNANIADIEEEDDVDM
jgi:hypothetical protein